MTEVYQYLREAQQWTQGGNNRHLFITSKGILFATFRDNYAGINFMRSADNGQTWQDVGTIAGGSITCQAEYSVFCDEMDQIHVVYARYQGASGDGRYDKATIIYRHAYMNTDHSAFYWSVEVSVTGYDYWHCPDVVAHEHNGQIRAHIVCAYSWAGDNRHILCYSRYIININDSANHVLEAQQFTHDTVGSQTFPGRPSIELRNSGDGKTQEVVNGNKQPDVAIAYTHNTQLHYARYIWVGGNTWNLNVVKFVDDSGDQPSVSNTSTYGGLYEHHRWTKLLYDRRDQRWIIIGWHMHVPSSYQALHIFELNHNNDILIAYSISGNWSANPNVAITMIGGQATLLHNSDVYCWGNTHWYSGTGEFVVSRPRGSNTRTQKVWNTQDGNDTSGNGARASVLPYPQGQIHTMNWRNDHRPIHYRGDRWNDYVNVGGSLVRKPKFRKRSDGLWVPCASKIM